MPVRSRCSRSVSKAIPGSTSPRASGRCRWLRYAANPAGRLARGPINSKRRPRRAGAWLLAHHSPIALATFSLFQRSVRVRGRNRDRRRTGMSISFSHLEPIVAIIAGVLILLAPRILNYVVAIYLIVIGILGLHIIHY